MAAVAHVHRPVQKALASAQSDPRFQKLLVQLKQSSGKVKQHPPAAKKAMEAQAAAKGPANEKLAGAKAKQVDKMKEAEGKKPAPSAFLALLRAEIEKVMPQNLDQADKFMKGGEKEQLKGAAGGNVSKQKQDAAGPVQQASSAAPSDAGVPGKEATPILEEAAPAPAPVDANSAVPAPKPAGDVSQAENKKDADQQLKDAEVTPDQLKKANDPRFSGVLTAKTNVEKVADTSPGKYRAGEKAALVAGIAKAAGDAKAGLATIQGVKKSSGVAVKSRQQLAKEKDEAERTKVTTTIEGIYTETKVNVEKKLATLETDVMTRFDRGINVALASMQRYANTEVDRFNKERYSGVIGAARWVIDRFRPVAEEIKQILAKARTQFTAQMDALAVEVSGTVDARLKEAKGEVAKGQTRIDTYVKGLPKNLQAVGKEAQSKVADRFKELEQGIDAKANDLAQKLAQKYKEASDKADAALKKIEEENEGAFKGLIDKLGEVVKALLEFKAKLMAVLKKGADAIKKILADPIGFLGNLIGALKKGFQQFVGNIWKHLKAGFMKWLFGALADAGIQIPADLNVWSVLKLVLDVLGLTYAWIRGEAVKLIGERNVMLIEKLVEYITITIKGGPKALWEKLKEDLANLKAMVIDAIQGWLIDTVVKSAVTKVLSMFNPAGAIVQAIMMIYNVVMWVIENASRILSLIEAVVNSVSAIADGNIGGAATWIENALASAIPIVIAFLARLIGLGGISAKIKEFITKVQAKVRAAVLGWLKKAWAWVKKLFGKLTGKDKKDERTKAEKRRDLEHAVGDAEKALGQKGASSSAIRATLSSIKSKYRLEAIELKHEEGPKFHVTARLDETKNSASKALEAPKVSVGFTLPGQSHTITVESIGGNFKIFMASAREELYAKFQGAHAALDNWRMYFKRVQAKEVKDRFESELLPKINKLRDLHSGEFESKVKAIYAGDAAQAEKFAADVEAKVQELIAEISAWAQPLVFGDLDKKGVDKKVEDLGTTIWQEEWRKRKKAVETILGAYPQLQYRGSLKGGEKNEFKGKIRFNPDDFDVDVFLRDNDKYINAKRLGARVQNGKIWGSQSRLPEVVNLSTEVRGKLKNAKIPGLDLNKFDIALRAS